MSDRAHTNPSTSPEDTAATVRDGLLDAAGECYRRFGIRKTTVDDIAKAAGLSRATAYRTFKNRDEILVGVVAREAYQLAAEAQVYLAQFDDVGSWIVEGLVFSLREIPSRPLLAMIFNPEDTGLASRLVLLSTELSEVGAAVLRPMFEPAQRAGQIRETVQVEMVIEWVLRLLVSYLTTPSRLATSEDAMRKMLRAMVLPSVLKTAEDPDPAPHPRSRND